MEQVYHRQQGVEITLPDVVSVVGCGGTGFWTALFLAMSGVKEIILVDHDRVELSNLNRLPLSGAVGAHKVNATYNFIRKQRPETRIEVHHIKIDADTCDILRGTVFCCTDNIDSQQVICAYCRKNNLPYQRIGYDGNILNVSRGFPLTFGKIEEQTGYEFDPSWVVPAALAAAAGVSSQLYKEICLTDDIGMLVNKDSSSVPEVMIDRLLTKKCDNCDYHGNTGRCNACDYYGNDGYCEDCDKVDQDVVCNACDKVDQDTAEDNFVYDIDRDNVTRGIESSLREWGIRNLTAEDLAIEEAKANEG